MINTYVIIRQGAPDTSHHIYKPYFYNSPYLVIEETEKEITIEVNSKTHQHLKFNKNFIDQ